METNITRINFFDGLFLRQGEFLAEQLYHLHMRRRVYYMLFDGSGVVQVEPGDLRITPTGEVADRTFLVKAGMAISRRDDLREGREIVLKEGSRTFDLDDENFVPGQEVFVAIHYEEALIEPQTGVQPNTETRIEERAVISLHNAAERWPPAPRPDGENYILLGKIAYDSMQVDDETQRQTARLRPSLIGGGVQPPAPTIETMAPSSAAPGDTDVPVRITGTNLNGVTVTVSGTGVGVSDVQSTSTTIDFKLTIGGDAPTDPRTLTVNNGSDTAMRQFLVGRIAFFDPEFAQSGQRVTIHGSGIRDSGLQPPFSAQDTEIVLIALNRTVAVDVTSIQVLADAGGNQLVRFTMPPRDSSWSRSQEVVLQFIRELDDPMLIEKSYQYADQS